MRKLLLIVAGMTVVTLRLGYAQNDLTVRRTPDTELFTRGDEPHDPHYARVDRFDQVFETHSSPGQNDRGLNYNGLNSSN
jgi:hypothetical protein